MSDRIKEQNGASFASLIHGKVTLWNILGAGLSIWLSISLVLLWRYMINLTEEIKNE